MHLLRKSQFNRSTVSNTSSEAIEVENYDNVIKNVESLTSNETKVSTSPNDKKRQMDKNSKKDGTISNISSIVKQDKPDCNGTSSKTNDAKGSTDNNTSSNDDE